MHGMTAQAYRWGYGRFGGRSERIGVADAPAAPARRRSNERLPVDLGGRDRWSRISELLAVGRSGPLWSGTSR